MEVFNMREYDRNEEHKSLLNIEDITLEASDFLDDALHGILNGGEYEHFVDKHKVNADHECAVVELRNGQKLTITLNITDKK